tara:strand:- start:428 stop:1372 length:945 start_codon:yes stop_codon:yes gene_type:complete
MNFTLLIVYFTLSFVINYLVQKQFIRYKRFDDINHRSSHRTLSTRTGGIGVFLTILIISLFYYFQGVEIFDYSLFIPLGIMFIVGVYDDLYNADFKLKFLLQIIVAKILIDQGFVISNYHGLFGLYEVPWILAQLSTVFVFLVIVNAINFIDGIDGLAISEVIKIILIIEFFSNDLTALAPLGLLVISALIPLYYFNFKSNTKVFLGDGGSMLLGTIIMIYILTLLGENYSLKNELIINKTLLAVLVTFYPLVDLLRVFVLRIKNGKSPFEADQRHIHHFLNNKFNSHFKVTFIILIIEILVTTFCVFINQIRI